MMSVCNATIKASKEHLLTTLCFVAVSAIFFKLLMPKIIGCRLWIAFRAIFYKFNSDETLPTNCKSGCDAIISFRNRNVDRMQKRQWANRCFQKSKRHRLHSNNAMVQKPAIIEDTEREQLSLLHKVMFHFDSDHLEHLLSSDRHKGSANGGFCTRTERKGSNHRELHTLFVLNHGAVTPEPSVQTSSPFTSPGISAWGAPSPYDYSPDYFGTRNETITGDASHISTNLNSSSEQDSSSLENDLISGKLYGTFHTRAVLTGMASHKNEIGMCSAKSTESLLGGM